MQEVKKILKRSVPYYEIWAFGSRVTGKVKAFSVRGYLDEDFRSTIKNKYYIIQPAH